MIWIFALGILVLATLHKGFRKVALWLGGIAGAIGIIVLVIAVLSGRQI